jgi:hypothetical protein
MATHGSLAAPSRPEKATRKDLQPRPVASVGRARRALAARSASIRMADIASNMEATMGEGLLHKGLWSDRRHKAQVG